MEKLNVYFDQKKPNLDQVLNIFRDFLESDKVIMFDKEINLINYTVYLYNALYKNSNNEKYYDDIKNKLENVYIKWKDVISSSK